MPPTPPNIQIREATDDDYPAIAAIYNAINTDETETAEDFLERNRKRDPKCKYQRWVAVSGGQIAGTVLYTQQVHDYDPKKFVVMAWVHPDYQGRGIGRMLFAHVTTQLRPLKPATIHCWTREDCAAGVKMLKADRFSELQRTGMSTMDVSGFDLAPYANLESSILKHGIEIKTLAELADDPERDRKIYDLEWELIGDIPGQLDLVRPSLETFVKESINAKGHPLNGNFIAVHGDEYVGLCLLQISSSGNDLNTNMTGVKRAYRRKGIALALKLRAVTFAKANGIPIIRTTNHVINRPMLAINDQLGFTRSSVWIQFEKTLTLSSN